MKKLGLYLLIMILFYAFWIGVPILAEKGNEMIDEKKMKRVIYDVKEENGKTIIILGHGGYSIEDDLAA